MTPRIAALAATATAGLLLAACSAGEEAAEQAAPASSAASSAAPSSPAGAAGSSSEAQPQEGVMLEDAVVRAKPAGEESPMTAVFGTLHNHSDRDVTVTGFSTSLGQARYEVHETENGTMSPVEGGLKVPAGQSVELAPGGYHLMILDYPGEIAAGDSIDVTLHTDQGDVVVPGVQVRSMIPGEESYGEGGEMAGHEGHEGHEHH